MGFPQIESLPQRFENENAYINEIDLINGFGRVSPGFWFRSTSRVGPGSGVATTVVVLQCQYIQS